MDTERERKKPRCRRLLGLMVLLASVCLFVYPCFADSLSGYRQTIVIGGYAEDYNALTKETASSLKQEAEKYNERILETQKQASFRYEGEQYDDPGYDAVLKTSSLSDVMAYVEIPLTGAYIPVVHGTRSEDLAYQAGHMHGTSVPIGGEDTHCVIGAHTGLKSAKLFTGIENLEPGDPVYLHVLDEHHVYTVREINTVLPEDADYYLQIEAGKDLLTLYTCTPYGVNSHRLLVKCERTGDIMETADGDQRSIETHNRDALVSCILWAMLPAGILTGGLLLIFTKRGSLFLDRVFRIHLE